MLSITEITEDPSQEFIIPVVGYADAILLLEWKDTQNAWFLKLTWNGRTLSGLRVTRANNLLTQYRSSFPFGINVTTTSRQDPITETAWTQDGAVLSILSESELDEYGI